MRNEYGLALSGLAAALASVVCSAGALPAIEYLHAGDGHYFVTAAPDEIAALDGGTFVGWSRTGESFGVLTPATAGAANVCRFWNARATTHFYSPVAAECAALATTPGWTFEGEVFALVLPATGGTCGTGTMPLYRLYNNGQGGAPNHRYTTSAAVRSAMLAQGWIAEGTGIGVIGCAPEATSITGHVIDGVVADARVCLDENRNGRCDAAETTTWTDATGAYTLGLAKDATAPLVAEIIAGRSREGGTAVDASFRMVSPSPAYGADINPFSTMVYLTGQANLALAEDLTRDILGLPPKFDLRLPAPAPAGSVKQGVASAVVVALKTTDATLDLAAPQALAEVIGAFPAAITALPALRIATKDAAPIVSREEYVDATYVLTNPAVGTTVTLNGKIRGRGHSTWGQPKNPYKVQFTSDAAYSAITDVLGMKKQRNWALLADWFDRSLVRNKLALSLGNSTVFADGLKWTPSGQHLEVWLNGDYVGVYLLTEDIRIDPARLAIRKMSADPADQEVDGGYLVEVDETFDCYSQGELNLRLLTPAGAPFCIKNPDEGSITLPQVDYIKAELVTVESDIYNNRSLGRLNMTSFADWYLLQELFRNNDAVFVSSDYMWKDADSAAIASDRLLNMGPIWDFDRGGGNVNYNDNWLTQGCWVNQGYSGNWYTRLFDHPDFLALTIARWQQKRPALGAFVNASVDTYVRRLDGAEQRNFGRWPILGTQLINYYTFTTYEQEVGFLRDWLNQRMAWMDQAFASPEAFTAMCK